MGAAAEAATATAGATLRADVYEPANKSTVGAGSASGGAGTEQALGAENAGNKRQRQRRLLGFDSRQRFRGGAGAEARH